MQNDLNLSEILRGIAENINDTYVQQFLANQVSALHILASPELRARNLELRHAYPFAAVQERNEALGEAHHISEEALEQAIRAYVDATGTPYAEVVARIHQRGRKFASKLKGITERRVIPSSLGLKTRIDQIAAEVPLFNSQYQPLHLAELRTIADQMGIRLISVPDLTLLSLCASVELDGEMVESAVFFKGEALHPALVEFLIAHELGHYWLHTRPDPERRSYEDLYLRSALDWGHLENEADSLALIVLFPTPYLSWCEHEGRLDAESVMADYLAGMPPPRAQPLYDRIRDYIQKRIDSYRLYKMQLDNAGLTPRAPLTIELAQMVIEIQGDDRCWFVIDDTLTIRNCRVLAGRGRACRDSRRLHPAYATLGYRPCPDGESESDLEKIAIYGVRGIPRHAARQLASGRWTSKMGDIEDIEHTLEAIEGEQYGTVIQFLARPRPLLR